MREDIIREIEIEYEQQKVKNEQEETLRKERIRREQPDIYALTVERENLIIGTLRNILKHSADTKGLPEKMEALSSQIRLKLTENGFPADYLAPVYRCPICKDTGKTGDLIKEPCECYKKAYQRKLRERIGLDQEKNESFENFNLNLFSNDLIDGEEYSQRYLMEICRDDCKEWAECYPNCKYRDVFINGKSGLGKTFLLRAIANKLIERNVDVLIISAYKIIEMLRKNFFENDGIPEGFINTEVLMIDDLGSEPMMQNVTIEQLFNLLNERQNKGLSTLVSTNLSIEEFKERYTERIASRLNDERNCLIITLIGKDIRGKG